MYDYGIRLVQCGNISSATVHNMITEPTRIGKKPKIDLSLFLKIAMIPVKSPARPIVAMAKVGRGTEYCIFSQIKTTKAILSPTDHLPHNVQGKRTIFISLFNTWPGEVILRHSAVLLTNDS